MRYIHGFKKSVIVAADACNRLMLAIHVIFLLPNCYSVTAPMFENHVIIKH